MIMICFPHADACVQFQIPDVKVMFCLPWMCTERENWTAAPAKWLCGCSTGKRGTSLIFLEWTEISCKAEMLCLGQARAELRSANKLGCFVQLCYTIGIPAQLCENICSLTCYTSRLETNWMKSIERSVMELWTRMDLQISVNLYVFWLVVGALNLRCTGSFSLWY